MLKGDFTASKTLIKAGEQVIFESLCSESAKEIVWEIEGANVNTKKGKKVVAQYEKAGSYTVTIYAKNETGTSKKEIKKCVVVKEDLPEQLMVLSDNCKASSSSFLNENEAPQFAVDGEFTKKMVCRRYSIIYISIEFTKKGNCKRGRNSSCTSRWRKC